MAKVLIYEDGEDDLIARYASLTTQHDVHVRHNRVGPMFWDHERFREFGFNPENFQNGYGNPKSESADVYFLDGLNGHCFYILPDLPKERIFVNSSSEMVNQEAKKRGFNVVGNESVDAIVERIARKI